MGLNTAALTALKDFILARRAAAVSAPEQKMLQGVYRGYAGDAAGDGELFMANQKKLADYYATRRAAQTGEAPHAEMLLIEPEAGRQYRLAPMTLPELGLTEPLEGLVRKLPAAAAKERTQLYARGGPIKAQAGGPFIGHAGEEANLGPDHVAPGRHKGGLNQIKECTCGR